MSQADARRPDTTVTGAGRDHDLFVSYADADRDWVTGYLVPALGLPAGRLLIKDGFRPGASVVAEFERAVRGSRFTLIVLSEAYLADDWSVFGELLASHADVADGVNRLVPLLLEPCRIPLHVDFRVRLDCTDEARWEAEATRLRELLGQPGPPPDKAPVCPYPGMLPFGTGDARFFHGREAEVADLLRRLRYQRFLLVVGPSGSGKSSLVSAGLVPELIRKDGDRWLVRPMRPGGAPSRVLAAVLGGWPSSRPDGAREAVDALLAEHPSAQRVLLVVDQLEEAFALAPDDERAAFVSALVALQEVDRCVVVVTMRADFYPELMTSDLWPVAPEERLEITPPRGAALRRALERPAADVGVHLEPGLLERLLADAADEPGVLPLLQETMVLLWEDRRRRLLTRAAYDALGADGRSGLAVALATRADAALASLDVDQRAIARRIFLRLIQLGEGREDTRRQQPVAALRTATEHPARFDATLRHLTGQRLLTLSGEEGEDQKVDLAHEALIAGWPTMRRWIEQGRQGLRVQRQLAEDTKAWAALARDPGALYRGARLAAVGAWADEQPNELNLLEREFLDASRRDAASELEAVARRNRRLRRLVAGLAVLLVVALMATALAVQASVRAAQKSRVALSRQLATQALTKLDQQPLARSLLLGVEALQTDDTPEARSALLAALQRTDPRLVAILVGDGGPMRSVAFSPDGRILAAGGNTGSVLRWDIASRRPLGEPVREHRQVVQALAFGPDGRVLASGGGDVVLTDARSGRPLAPPIPVPGAVESLAFNRNGTVLAAGGFETVVLWDVASRRPLGELPVRGGASVATVAFRPDGHTLVASADGGGVTVWDVRRRRLLTGPASGDRAFTRAPKRDQADPPLGTSDNAGILAGGTEEGTVRLWNVPHHRNLRAPLTGHTGSVEDVAVSGDGRRVAAGGFDKTVLVWDTATGRRLGAPLVGHTDELESVAFGPDGNTLASGGNDGTVILWDLNARPSLRIPLSGHGQTVWSVAFSPDGRTLVSGSGDQTTILWDVAARRRLAESLRPGGAFVRSVAVDPDGRTLITGGGDGVVLWDLARRQRLGDLTHAATTAVALSSDGRTLATGGADGTVGLWDIAGGRPLGAAPAAHRGSVNSVAFSPDARTLASGSEDGTVVLWDVASRRSLGAPVAAPSGGNGSAVGGVAFSPDDDGRTLAFGGADGTVVLWDVRARRRLDQPLAGHVLPVLSMAFSPDGRMLASGFRDGTVVVWDARQRRRLEELAGHTGPVYSVAFGPDGRTLASGGSDGAVVLWDLRLDSWRQRACAIANRNLTQAEWDQFIGSEQPYRRTCPDVPPG
jgi:WD40 repeat protein